MPDEDVTPVEAPVVEQPADPAPVEPQPETPAEPMPVEPTPEVPAEPAPVDPTPVEPTPVDPVPVEPAPVDPVPEVPAEPPVDVVGMIESLVEKLTALKQIEKDQLSQIAALQLEVSTLKKQLMDAGVIAADPSVKFYSQAELDSKLALKDAEVADKVASAVASARSEEQASASQKIADVKAAAKAAIAKVKDADDGVADEESAKIDAM